MKALTFTIYDHPLFGATTGSFCSFLVYQIDIPHTTQMLELIGAAVKDVGIGAGAIVAVASLISYMQKNWFKKKA